MVRPTAGSKVTTIDPASAGVKAPPVLASAQDQSAGIVQGNGADWFGPLNPMVPSAPPEVAGRQWDFPSGYNLWVIPRSSEAISFADLRALGDAHDITRLVIETRKDQMTRQRWSVRPRTRNGKPMARLDDPRIYAIEDFWRRPDGDHTWNEWLRMIVEDMLVLDAATLWRERTRGGGLYALHPIDGATIKPVIDDWGRRPRPPAPAYQQALKGLPAVNYLSSELLYKPRNPRTNRAYGYSPVEQIIVTVNIALRRQMSVLGYYTEGNIPAALAGTPEGWTPDQIKAFQDYFDDYFSGQEGLRRRMRFVPSSVAQHYQATQEPPLKDQFDEWLARVVCYAFSVSPQPFVQQVNRSTAETAQVAAEEEGLSPLLDWVKGLVDDVVAVDMGAPEFEFAWQEDDETSPLDQMETVAGYVKIGVLSHDEARAKIGEDPLPGSLGNVPMVLTATGFVPLDNYEMEQAQTAENAKTMAAAVAAGGGKPGQPPNGQPAVAKPGAEGNGEEVGKSAAAPFLKAAKGVPPTRLEARQAARTMRSTWEGILGRQAAQAAALVSTAGIHKAAGDDDGIDVEAILRALGLDPTDAELQAIIADYVAVFASGAVEGYASLRSAPDGLFEQFNERAHTWAQDEAAWLVSETSDTTKAAIRKTIADGLAAGLSTSQISETIGAATAFSDRRADLIAHTEIASANSAGALAGYLEVAALGVDVRKRWIITDEACEICLRNQAQGPIGLTETFQSGDAHPPGHPNCRCALVPVVGDEDLE